MDNAKGADGSTAVSLRSRLISGGIWGAIGKVLGVFAGLAANVLLARILTLEEMGAYTLLLTVINVAGLLAMLGLPQAIVRQTAELLETGRHGEARGLLSFACRSALAAGLLALLVCGAAGGTFFPTGLLRIPAHPSLSWEIGALIMLLAWQGILSAAFKGFSDIRSCVIFGGLLQSLLYVIILLAIYLAVRQSALDLVLGASIAAGSASLAAGSLLLRRKVGELPACSGRGAGLFRDAPSLLMVSLVPLALNQSDIWLITAFRPVGDVAKYGAALRLAQAIPFFLLIANTVLSPIIAQLRVSGRMAELESVLRKVTGVAFVPAFALAVLFFLLGGPLLRTLFGPQYAEGAVALSFLAVGQLFNVWSGPCGLILLMTGLQNWLTGITLLSSAAGVGAALLLVDRFGMSGVAVASSGALALQSVLSLLLVKRKLGIWSHVRICAKGAGDGVLAGVTRE